MSENEECNECKNCVEGESTLQSVGVDKSDDWIRDALKRAKEYSDEYNTPLNCIMNRYLYRNFPAVIVASRTCPTLSKAMGDIAKIFIQIGYSKGLIDGEARAIRDKWLRRLIDG